VRRRIEPALHEFLQPGDRVLAGFEARTGLSPNWEVLMAVPFVLLAALAGWDVTQTPSRAGKAIDGVILIFGPLFLSTALSLLKLRRVPLFIAVTQQQLICYCLSRRGGYPVRAEFCAPLAAVRLTTRRDGLLPWRSLKHSGAGNGGKELRLSVHWPWRQDLREALAAVQAGGGAAETGQTGLLIPDGLAWSGPTQG